MSLSKRSYDAKNYYRATIILAEAYVRTDDKALIEKSIFMLESIFPKVLLVKSKQLTSELYLTYAEALDASSSTGKFCKNFFSTGYSQLFRKSTFGICHFGRRR